MKAGQTNLKVGTKVKVIKCNEDKEIIGLVGKATHPFAFGCTDKGWIGIWLDKDQPNGADIDKICIGGNINVPVSNVEIIE